MPQQMQQAGMMSQDMMQAQASGMTMMSYPMMQVQQQQTRTGKKPPIFPLIGAYFVFALCAQSFSRCFSDSVLLQFWQFRRCSEEPTTATPPDWPLPSEPRRKHVADDNGRHATDEYIAGSAAGLCPQWAAAAAMAVWVAAKRHVRRFLSMSCCSGYNGQRKLINQFLLCPIFFTAIQAAIVAPTLKALSASMMETATFRCPLGQPI